MMRAFLLTLLLALPTFGFVRAQEEPGDSVPPLPLPESLESALFEARMRSPLGIMLLPRSRFARTTLAYGYAGGRLMPVQEPLNADDVQVRSIGSYTVKSVRLYGEFAYLRAYEDSLRWLLSEKPTDGMPYYFGSPKAGNTEREHYRLAGMLGWNVSRQLIIGASVQIDYRKGTRSNDPRSATESFISRYDLMAGLTLAQLSLSVDGGWGYGTRDNDLVYNNPSNDRIGRADMMAYELMGFGMNRKTQQFHNRSLESDVRTLHGGVQVQTRINRFALWGRLSWDNRCDSIRRSRTTNVGRSLLSAYTTTTMRAELGADYAFSPVRALRVQAEGESTKGFDWLKNILLGQKNYVYDHRTYGVQALFTHHRRPAVTDQYGLSAAYVFEKRQDGATQHVYRQRSWTGRLSWNRRRALRSSLFVVYGARQGFTFPRAELFYPATQENIFTTNVAHPLCDYHNTAQAVTGFIGGVGKRIGRYHLLFSLSYDLAYPLFRSHNASPSSSQAERVGGTRGHLLASVLLGL